MRKAFVLIFLLSVCFCFSQVNIEEIKENVTENPQKYYYDNLNIFKINPEKLTQDELDYIYYGRNYVDYGYVRKDFNEELDKVTKFARRKISAKLARDILPKATELYEINPTNKESLLNLVNIHDKLGNSEKSNLYSTQYQLLVQTIGKSGTGKLDNFPIVVTDFSDKFLALEKFSTIFNPGIDFKTKVLPDGSWLDIFKNGDELFFIRSINHKDMFKDD